jgi:hypothetical protein
LNLSVLRVPPKQIPVHHFLGVDILAATFGRSMTKKAYFINVITPINVVTITNVMLCKVFKIKYCLSLSYAFLAAQRKRAISNGSTDFW